MSSETRFGPFPSVSFGNFGPMGLHKQTYKGSITKIRLMEMSMMK